MADHKKRQRGYVDGTHFIELQEPDGSTSTHEIELKLRDTLRFEQMEGKSPLAGIGTDGMFTMLATTKLIWLAMRRLKLTNEQRFKDFEARVIDVWQVDDDDADDDGDGIENKPGSDDVGGVQLPDPTQPTPIDG